MNSSQKKSTHFAAKKMMVDDRKMFCVIPCGKADLSIEAMLNFGGVPSGNLT